MCACKSRVLSAALLSLTGVSSSTTCRNPEKKIEATLHTASAVSVNNNNTACCSLLTTHHARAHTSFGHTAHGANAPNKPEMIREYRRLIAEIAGQSSALASGVSLCLVHTAVVQSNMNFVCTTTNNNEVYHAFHRRPLHAWYDKKKTEIGRVTAPGFELKRERVPEEKIYRLCRLLPCPAVRSRPCRNPLSFIRDGFWVT